MKSGWYPVVGEETGAVYKRQMCIVQVHTCVLVRYLQDHIESYIMYIISTDVCTLNDMKINTGDTLFALFILFIGILW